MTIHGAGLLFLADSLGRGTSGKVPFFRRWSMRFGPPFRGVWCLSSPGLQPPQVRWLEPPGTHPNHLLRR